MKIEDLYLELGRAMTEKITAAQESKAKQDMFQEQIQTINREWQSERDRTASRQERIQRHVDELQEAIRLVAEGVDPTLAKLTAKESLEERRAVEKITKATNNGNYTITNPYGLNGPVTLPITAAGGGAAINAGNGIQWVHHTNLYGSGGYTPTA